MSLIVGYRKNMVITKRDVLVSFEWEMVHEKMTLTNLLTRLKYIFLLIFNDQNWYFI